MTRKKKADTNLLASLGSRPNRRQRVVTPPRKIPAIPQSISAAFGISTSDQVNNQRIRNGHYDNEEFDDNPDLAHFIPRADESEINESTIPTVAHQFAQDSRDYWNSEARRNEKLKWSAIESQMTATYLECQHRTKNWTSQACYLDVNINCQCEDNQITIQTVDLFNQLSFLSQKEIMFCSCMPRPVRLLHYGYIASSTQFPKTAFSIPLVQFHHQLWNETVVASTGFVNALMKFLLSRSDRSNTYTKPQNNPNRSLLHNRDLRTQFSHSVNTYRAMVLCTKRIYTEGLKISNAQLLADRCARCFGPAIAENKISPQEPDVIIALDGNFQHRHYTQSSKDNPNEEEYPDIFVKPSFMKKNEMIQNITETQVKDIKVTKWLLRRLKNAQTVSHEARISLTNLSRTKSALFPTISYTNDFLRQQWFLERHSQKQRCHVKEEQQLELGRLLYYEEMAKNEWDQDVSNVEQGYSRLDKHITLKKRIEKQRAKIGSEAVLNDLNSHEQDQILKIWYAKQAVRDQFVAICEQKRPLDISRRDGKHSSIGHNDKTPLLKTLRDQAARLKTKLEIYQKMLTTYSLTSPHRSQPANITYAELLKIDHDHSFWNDGLFTNGREPWAIDANTQHGMRQVAYMDRASEEIRRIGWEVRRVMRWAIESHNSLHDYLLRLLSHKYDEGGLAMDLPLIQHPSLTSLSGSSKVSAAQIIINEKLARVLNLQIDWNPNLLEVFNTTPPQDGDNDLRLKWCNQVLKIQGMYSKCAIVLNPGIITRLDEEVGDDHHGDIHMEKQEADKILSDQDAGGDGVVDIYDYSDETQSDEELDMEEEEIYEALTGFSTMSVT
ncbi:hypothetical protein DFH28DRAFT_1172432 [Melampsora americana]|nr:hypothetical protein DFH28DRAFT_1172432 [Melampsora americana]